MSICEPNESTIPQETMDFVGVSQDESVRVSENLVHGQDTIQEGNAGVSEPTDGEVSKRKRSHRGGKKIREQKERKALKDLGLEANDLREIGDDAKFAAVHQPGAAAHTCNEPNLQQPMKYSDHPVGISNEDLLKRYERLSATLDEKNAKLHADLNSRDKKIAGLELAFKQQLELRIQQKSEFDAKIDSLTLASKEESKKSQRLAEQLEGFPSQLAREEDARLLDLANKKVNELKETNQLQDAQIENFAKQVGTLESKLQSLTDDIDSKTKDLQTLKKARQDDVEELKRIQAEMEGNLQSERLENKRLAAEMKSRIETERLEKEATVAAMEARFNVKILEKDSVMAEQDALLEEMKKRVESHRIEENLFVEELEQALRDEKWEKDETLCARGFTIISNLIRDYETSTPSLDNVIDTNEYSVINSFGTAAHIEATKPALAEGLAEGKTSTFEQDKEVSSLSADGFSVKGSYNRLWQFLLFIMWFIMLLEVNVHMESSVLVHPFHETSVNPVPTTADLPGHGTIVMYEQVCFSSSFPRPSTRENIWEGIEGEDSGDDSCSDEPSFTPNPLSAYWSSFVSTAKTVAESKYTTWVVLGGIHMDMWRRDLLRRRQMVL